MNTKSVFVRRAAVAALFLAACGSADAAEGARYGLVTQGVILNGPILQGLQLNGPILQGVQFNGPVLQGLQFNGPIIQGMRLNGPIFQGIQFNGPVFQGVRFNGPVIQGYQFNGPVLQGLRMNGPVIQGTNLQSALPLTAAFDASGNERAMYGMGQGIYPVLTSASEGAAGHSPLSGLDSRYVRVRRIAR